MPRTGVEATRRKALLTAAIDEIGRQGSLDVTVAQIARRAGVSSALAHHYLGSKDEIFVAAMRLILMDFGAEVRRRLAAGQTPMERVAAIVAACFAADSFRPEVAQAWLNFYVLAQRSDPAARLLWVYHRRLHSNLTDALRPLLGDEAARLARSTGALVDGIYLRSVLPSSAATPARKADDIILEHVENAIAARR